jgi:hypothetical protein
MVKHHKDTYKFDHNWSETVEGAFGKYPNDFQPNIQSLDILDRRINENGHLITEKLLKSKFIPNILMQKSMSALGMPILNSQINLEISTLDLEKKRFSLESCNDTYLKWLKVRESLCYSECTQDTKNYRKTKTLLTQLTSADMYSKSYPLLLQWAVTLGEKAVIAEVKSNIPKGRSAMATVIPNLIDEFTNCYEYTEIKLKENSDLAKIMIEKFGNEAIEGINKITDEIKSMQLDLNIVGNVEKIEESCHSLTEELKNLKISCNNVSNETEILITKVINQAEIEIINLMKLIKNKLTMSYQETIQFQEECENKIAIIYKNALKEMDQIKNDSFEKVRSSLDNNRSQHNHFSDKYSRESFEKLFDQCKNKGIRCVDYQMKGCSV